MGTETREKSPYAQAGSRAQFDDGVLNQAFARLPLAVLFDPELSAGAKTAYAALAWYAFKRTDLPSQHSLARELGIARRTFQRHLAELCDARYVRTVRRGRNGPATYVVTTAGCASQTGDPEQPLAPSTASEVRHERRTDGVTTGATRTQDSTSQELPQEVGRLVVAFFESIGEDWPSRERREKAAEIILDLSRQGYPTESLMETMYLADERDARGPELLPYLIGEAHQRVAARKAAAEERARAQAAFARQRDEESEQLRAEIAAIEALPEAECRRLLALARKRLPHGVSEAMERRLLPGLLAAVRRREAATADDAHGSAAEVSDADGPSSATDFSAVIQVPIDPAELEDRAAFPALAAVESP